MMEPYLHSLRAGRPGFDYRQGYKRFSPLRTVQIGSDPHPASHPVGTGGCFPWVKVAGATS
jgi:hypothetical protein